MGKLDQNQIAEAISGMKGWVANGDWIAKEFQFDDFKQAIDFMVKAGDVAEELNHHPNWSNVWNKVNVELQTHSEGGVTEKDLELAQRMDALV